MSLTVVVGDAGSSSNQFLLDMACESVGLAKSVICIDSSGDLVGLSKISSYVNYECKGDAKFFVANFIGSAFREKYELPTISDVLSRRDVLMATFPNLIKCDDGLIHEAESCVLSVLDSVAKFENKNDVSIVILGFNSFGDKVAQVLIDLAKAGVDVLLSCEYKYYDKSSQVFDPLANKVILMKKDDNNMVSDDADLDSKLVSLGYGEGGVFDGVNLNKFEFTRQSIPLREIKFANALKITS